MNTNNFEITLINWIQNESDEQPTGVIVQVNNGDAQFLTIEEYNNILNTNSNGK